MRAGGEDAERVVHENQLDIVRLLVAHGADLAITDESGTIINKDFFRGWGAHGFQLISLPRISNMYIESSTKEREASDNVGQLVASLLLPNSKLNLSLLEYQCEV